MKQRTMLEMAARHEALISLKQKAVKILEDAEKYEDIPEEMKEALVKAVKCFDEASEHFDEIFPIMVQEYGKGGASLRKDAYEKVAAFRAFDPVAFEGMSREEALSLGAFMDYLRDPLGEDQAK